jgi:hypothetical protein
VLHTHSAPLSDQVIDGAVHPELIPDSTAYRLVFIVIGEPPNPAPQKTVLQTARLNADALMSILTPQGAASLDSYVQHENWGEAVTYTESTTAGGKSCPQANTCLNTTVPDCPVTLVIDQAGCFPFYLTYVPYIGTACFWANSSQRVSEPGVCATKAQ